MQCESESESEECESKTGSHEKTLFDFYRSNGIIKE